METPERRLVLDLVSGVVIMLLEMEFVELPRVPIRVWLPCGIELSRIFAGWI